MRERAAPLLGRRASHRRFVTRGLLAVLLPIAIAAAADDHGEVLSMARFRVRLFGISHVEGRFERVEARLVGDADGHQRIDAVIDLAALRMDSPRQQSWARSDEFFDAERFPRIRYASEPVVLAELAAGDHVDGQLTLRGERHPVALWIDTVDCTEPAPAPCSATAHTAVSRARFGMASQRAFLSDKVELSFDLRIARPAP